jgi:hypothetical protein
VGNEPAPPSRLMTSLDPSTASLLPLASPTSALVQGQFPNKAGPSLRGKRRAVKEGSLVDGPKTTLSLKDGSGRTGEHATPSDGLGQRVLQGVCYIKRSSQSSKEKMSMTPIERGIVGA